MLQESWVPPRVGSETFQRAASSPVAISRLDLWPLIVGPDASHGVGYEFFGKEQIAIPDVAELNGAHAAVSAVLESQSRAPITVRYLPVEDTSALSAKDMLSAFSPRFRSLRPRAPWARVARGVQVDAHLWPHGTRGALFHHDASYHRFMAYLPKSILDEVDRACCLVLLTQEWLDKFVDRRPRLERDIPSSFSFATNVDEVLGNLTNTLRAQLPLGSGFDCASSRTLQDSPPADNPSIRVSRELDDPRRTPHGLGEALRIRFSPLFGDTPCVLGFLKKHFGDWLGSGTSDLMTYLEAQSEGLTRDWVLPATPPIDLGHQVIERIAEIRRAAEVVGEANAHLGRHPPLNPADFLACKLPRTRGPVV